MSKILLIGGTGLISTAIAQQLIDRGEDITLFNRGKSPVRLKGEVKRLIGDRSDHRLFESLLRSAGPWDCVIDMVCGDPADAGALARACRGQVGQLIFCSTTNVYPKPADAYPVREEHRLGAQFASGQNKIECERLCREAQADGGFALTVIRPGHTYGEGGGVINTLGAPTSFLDRFRRGKPLVVHSDGNGLWSALHIDDVALVFVAAVGNATAFGRTYNATGQEWMTWDQYHDRIAQALGVPCPPLVHIPVDVLARLAPERTAQTLRSLQYPGLYDTSAAGRDFGFRQRIGFVEGMRRTIRWLDENQKIDAWATDPDYDPLIDKWVLIARQMADS